MIGRRLDPWRGGLFYLGVTLLAVSTVTAGCGPGGTLGNVSFTSPDDPMVSDLQVRAVTPAVSGRTIRWRITARVTDRNNDVVGGTARVTVHGVNDNEVHVDFPEVTMTIVPTDLAGDRLTAILVVENAPAGEMSLLFTVQDAAGNSSFGGGSFTVQISGRSAPGSATRPDEVRGALVHR